MGLFELSSEDWTSTPPNALALSRSAFGRFTPAILGLGDIAQRSRPIDAICAVFDLRGFTAFCKQVDPQLVVPHYLSSFLDWFFTKIRTTLTITEKLDEVVVWYEPPFFAKFMGDGLMLLWNCEGHDAVDNMNLVVALREVCRSYRGGFFPQARRQFSDPPTALRCGIARGTIFPVGNGQDFVGTSINVAARLQKLSLLTFAFARRGFNVEDCMPADALEAFVLKSVGIRGIGGSELVYVQRKEFDDLPAEEKVSFAEP